MFARGVLPKNSAWYGEFLFGGEDDSGINERAKDADIPGDRHLKHPSVNGGSWKIPKNLTLLIPLIRRAP
jgi:hypothetical protein